MNVVEAQMHTSPMSVICALYVVFSGNYSNRGDYTTDTSCASTSTERLNVVK